MSREVSGISLELELGPGDLQMLLLRLERGKDSHEPEGAGRRRRGAEGRRRSCQNLKDLLFRVLSSAASLRSRTASDGEDRRMREVAGAPSGVLGEPSRRPSRHCLTGSYSTSSCRVWLVQWIRSST